MKKTGLCFLALLFILTLFSACQNREAQPGQEPESQVETQQPSPQPEEPQAGTVAGITPAYQKQIDQLLEINEDTVGWIWVPGTFVDDGVLHRPDQNNNYYLRKDYDGSPSFNGCYYADKTAVIGPTRDDLGTNTCIYGHAMTDDPESENYRIKFGTLHDFRDPEFARETPYLFFSTLEDNMAFEIIAVFTANGDNTALPYNQNQADPHVFLTMIEEEILPRSLYLYDNVELSADDKFLTLSTCIYNMPDGSTAFSKNSFLRYAILARLVPPDEPLKDEAAFTINQNLVVDPDGYWPKNAA